MANINFIVNAPVGSVKIEHWRFSSLQNTLDINTEYSVATLVGDLRIYPLTGATITAVSCDKRRQSSDYDGWIWNWVSRSSGAYWECKVGHEDYNTVGLATTTVTATAPAPVPVLPCVMFLDDLGGGAIATLTDSLGGVVSVPTNETYSITTRGAYTLKVVPVEGGTIESKPTGGWSYYDPDEYIYTGSWKKILGGEGWYFEILPLDDFFSGVEKTSTIQSTAPTPDIRSPFNVLYYLDDVKLRELSLVMPTVYGEAAGEPGTAVDDSPYILNILTLPFELPVDSLGSELAVKIGSRNTSVMGVQITDETLDFDLGSMVVGGLENSSYDYTGAKFELVLPFVGKEVELTPSQVIGKTISVKYEVSAYDGDMTANVFNGDPEPIVSVTDNVGSDIPVHLLNEPQSKLGKYQTTNNGIMTAFIRVTRKETLEGQYSNLLVSQGVVGSRVGYVEVVGADLVGIPDSAIVLELLKGGVVVR